GLCVKANAWSEKTNNASSIGRKRKGHKVRPAKDAKWKVFAIASLRSLRITLLSLRLSQREECKEKQREFDPQKTQRSLSEARPGARETRDRSCRRRAASEGVFHI